MKGVNVERSRQPKKAGELIPRIEPAEGGKLMKEAMQVTRDPRSLERARKDLCKSFSSSSSRRAKEVKRQEVLTLATAVAEGRRPLPLSVDTVEKVAAAMKAAGFKSGPQYLGELRLAHVEAGYELGAWLIRAFRLCQKALERDRGPTRRAPEIRPEQLSRSCLPRQNKRCLVAPELAYLWAMTWMLREIEVRQVLWRHIRVQEENKLVTLSIQKSKMDQSGAGVRRTLTCCGKEKCDKVCAWHLAQELMKHKGEADDLVFLTREGKAPTKQDVVNSWKWISTPTCTGHSARRSGAMHYVRLGMNISELAYLGRWKSSAVLSYAEEALEEVAANRGHPVEQLSREQKNFAESHSSQDLHQPQLEDSKEQPHEKSPSGQAEDLPWPRVVNPPNALWVVTKGKGASPRPVHLVTQASWAIPLSKWNTACGWAFAERSSEFHFVPKPTLWQKKCRKCLALKEGRDVGQGGDKGALLCESNGQSLVPL